MKRQSKTEGKTIEYKGGKIRCLPNGSFAADLHQRGKRRRKQCDSLTAAKAFIDQEQAARDTLGLLAVTLTPKQVEDAADALAHLDGGGLAGCTLLDAARFYLRHHRPEPGGWTVATAFDEYIQHLAAPVDGTPARPRTLTDKRTRLSSFVDVWGETPIERITEQAVFDWLTSTGAQGRNLRNNKTQIQSLFNYAERNAPGDYKNTVARFPQSRAKEVAPAETVTPAQARAVLHALEEIAPRSAVVMALGLFAGIRTSEVVDKAGLLWTDIDMQERRITVPASQAKTRDAREVDIPENLLRWLAKYHRDGGRIGFRYNAFSKHRKAACVAAGVDWPANAARHTYATNYAALHGMRATADQLGHKGGIDMLTQHYKGKAVRKADAKALFSIVPHDAQANVIQLHA